MSLWRLAAPSRPLVMVVARSPSLAPFTHALPLSAGARPGWPSPFSPWHTPQVSLKNFTVFASAAFAPPAARTASEAAVAMRILRISVELHGWKEKPPGGVAAPGDNGSFPLGSQEAPLQKLYSKPSEYESPSPWYRFFWSSNTRFCVRGLMTRWVEKFIAGFHSSVIEKLSFWYVPRFRPAALV